MTVSSFLKGLFGVSGSMKPSRAVSGQFFAHQLQPELDYYFIGPSAMPDAIIGIDRNRSFKTGFWKKIEESPETLGTMVDAMHSHAESMIQLCHGCTIFDEKDRPVGIWFSLHEKSAVKIKDGELSVMSPDLSGAGSTWGEVGLGGDDG